MNQDVNDPRISEAYRDAATEAAPDALNRTVLRRARDAAATSSPYSRSIVWLRPMAWATTIGLCLAIVVDLNDVPRPAQSLTPAATASSPAAVIDDLPEQDVRADDKLEDISVDAEQEAAKDAAAPGELDTLQRARKSVDEVGRVTLSNLPQLEKADGAAPEPAALAPEMPAVASGLQSFEMAAQDFVGEAKELARRQEGRDIDNDGGGFALAAEPALESATAAAIETPCDAAARKTPQYWLKCIQGLETDGRLELATSQRDELRAAFPEFQFP